MSSEKKGHPKREREAIAALDSHTKDLRLQLNEQLRCLDARVETQIGLAAELQEYFRRRAEVELDYSRGLEKLAKSLQLRHREQRQKREQWHLFTSYSCWQHLVSQTKKESRDRAILSELYANNFSNRFTQITEDVQRIYRKCREIGYESHEELLKVLHELHTAMKTYYAYHGDYCQAEDKLKVVDRQKSKLELNIPKEKLERSRKYRLIEKEVQKRTKKFRDCQLKALKARNEYILCMDAANAAIHKYFVEDVSDIMDCMDFGFNSSVSRAMMMHVSAQQCVMKSSHSGLDNLETCLANLDSRLDKQKFIEIYNSAFMIPKKFEFQSHKDDEISTVTVNTDVQEEMENRYRQLCRRLTALKTESEEVWKTLETAEKTMLDMVTVKDYNCDTHFLEETEAPIRQPATVTVKLRADRQETEEFYLTKFHNYVLSSNLTARLQARYDLIRRVLSEQGPRCASLQDSSHIVPESKPRRKRIGHTPSIGHPKLFGGSLEEYVEATGQDIPLIIKSCIRVINLYGLHHQGIFRVSGSQVEINNFRDVFEKGDDPLADMTDASDINSIAGVLKLYLRELREPIFPIFYFEQFMELAQVTSKEDLVIKMRDVLQSLPRPVFVVMRYLFAFLNHLSEYSDENMMEPYNLAICFGPTLLPIPEDKDQVQYQNLVNDLMKNIILYAEELFPADYGIMYEKYISQDMDEGDIGESPSEPATDIDSEVYPSEDESEVLEAVAQFDFGARSGRELSFKHGDTLTLYTQVSSDWWKGNFNGKDGLIPDKYIMLKIRDDYRDRLSETSSQTRTSTSSDQIVGPPRLQRAPSPSPRPPSSSESLASSIGHTRKLSTSSASSHLMSFSSCDMALAEDSGVMTRQKSASSPSSPMSSRNSDPLADTNLVVTEPGSDSVSPQPAGEEKNVVVVASYGDIATSTTVGETHTNNFHSRRALWEKLSSSQQSLHSTTDGEVGITEAPTPTKSSRKHKTSVVPKQTPDLVMDLPATALSSSPKERSQESGGEEEGASSPGSSSSSSPNCDSPDMTAAERFARQHQSTLKKGTAHPPPSVLAAAGIVVDAQTQTGGQKNVEQARTAVFEAVKVTKPQVKVKPQVLRKPAANLPKTSPDTQRKDMS